jgi:hypothetical protein
MFFSKLVVKKKVFPIRILGRSVVETPMDCKKLSLGKRVFSAFDRSTEGCFFTKIHNWESEKP